MKAPLKIGDRLVDKAHGSYIEIIELDGESGATIKHCNGVNQYLNMFLKWYEKHYELVVTIEGFEV